MPRPLGEAFDAGLFELPARAASPGAARLLAAAPLQTSWYVPVILVDFSDQPLTWGTATFDSALFDTTGATPTGSVFDYYRWVSGDRMHITGRVVATVHLPDTMNFYAFDSWGVSFHATPRNACGLVTAALTACDATVDWRPFDRDHDGFVDVVWVLHSGYGGEVSAAVRTNMWSITSRLTNWNFGNVFTSNDTLPGLPVQRVRINNFSILPEKTMFHPGQPCEIGVFCHEFGHSLGLPDLYDASVLGGAANKGPGNWSLMSTGIYGADGYSPQYPAHLGAWASLFLGLASRVRPARDSTFLLPAIEAGGPVVELSFQGEPRSEHFLIENRQRMGFDRNLLGEGLIVYQVDDAIIESRLASNRVNSGPVPGLRLVEADGRRDLILGLSRGDAWDPFPGGGNVTGMDDDTSPSTRSNSNSPTNTALRNIEPVGDFVRFDAHVRAAGWHPPVDAGRGAFTPVVAAGPARRAVLLEDQTAAMVSSEKSGSHPQVVLRTRGYDRTWSDPVAISDSPTAAVEPTIAALPGSDLAVVWSDTRHGAHELYYRSRIRGVWGGERRLTDLPGACRAPAASADARGGVHVAWHYSAPFGAQIMFLYFPYTSPLGTPRAVTDTSNVPDLPAVAAAPDGASYVLWPEYRTGVARAWFSRFHPDSGFRSRQRLSPSGGLMEPSVDAVVDALGNLHSVWTAFGTGSELRYQLRDVGGAPPIPRDSVLVARGEPIQNASVAVDPLGGIHLVLEAAAGGTPQLLYKHREPDRGWDFGTTEAVTGDEGGGVRPALLAEHPRVVSLLYTGYPDGSAHLMERTRDLTATGPPTAVDEEPVAPRPPGPALGPNPVRAGEALVLRPGPGGKPGDRVEVFDITGRRVATAGMVQTVAGPEARFEPAVTRIWAAGVYLARRIPAAGSPGRATRFVVLR